MANCHKQFTKFNEELNVRPTTWNQLETAQASIKKHVEQYFDTFEEYKLRKFKVQGSKELGTLIRKHGKECDIDIGLCFYPKPNIQPDTLLRHLHTCMSSYRGVHAPVLKNKCVRVLYAGKFHIDLPVYYLERLRGDLNPHLATRNKGWVKSDPRKFEVWFDRKKNKNLQLIRIVRYLKAWCHQTRDSNHVPQGIALTALAGRLYKPFERDDEAFLYILKRIQKQLANNWSCRMPVPPFDELLKKFTPADIVAFREKIAAIIDDGTQALQVRGQQNACSLWKLHLGRYFPAK